MCFFWGGAPGSESESCVHESMVLSLCSEAVATRLASDERSLRSEVVIEEVGHRANVVEFLVKSLERAGYAARPIALSRKTTLCASTWHNFSELWGRFADDVP